MPLNETGPRDLPGAPTSSSSPPATATEAEGFFHDSGTGQRCTSSQQVSWWSVHEFVAIHLDKVGSWPMAGTPEWCALGDADPRKWAAVLDAAQHWSLRVETCQEARCDASREVSDALDWSALAREINVRADFYASRPWLRRVAS
jgi:hypothetical protein